MVQKNFNRNIELNAGGIPASSNVPTKALLEGDGDKQKQVDRIRIWMHVGFLRPPTSLIKKVQQIMQIYNFIVLVA